MQHPSVPSWRSDERQRSRRQQRSALGAALLAGALLFSLTAWVFSAAGAPVAFQRGLQANGGGDASSTATTLPSEGPDANRPTDPPSGEGAIGADVRPAKPAAEPVAVRIPAIGLEAGLVPLGLNNDGTLEVPSDYQIAGWYAGGPLPGELGPAVITGHVDSRSGPGAFFQLSRAEPGDEIFVHYGDGTTVSFIAERVEQHPKDAFPTRDVYGDTTRPELRLVTCGGSFDRSTGHYRDNVIVWAS
ncbi:MAG TPA: class F sortase [Acidimicrobiales bacterium]|nr:class F sortase [Acidimicrobiales bacterium]